MMSVYGRFQESVSFVKHSLGRSFLIAAFLMVISLTWSRGVFADELTSTLRNQPMTCSQQSIQVGIAENALKSYTIVGELCFRGLTPPDRLQLLVHGATYNNIYWDFPVSSPYYSYVAFATSDGFATFAVDRLGYGFSSHPPSALLTVTAGAYALHDVVSALRSGLVGGKSFKRIAFVGHSFGSLYGWLEVSKYQDVDAVIVTGALHKLSSVATNNVIANIYMASLDPRFSGLALDPGYLTTKPGTRGSIFYNLKAADPQVVEVDEQTKDIVTSSELATGLPIFQPSSSDGAPSLGIKVPVLIVVGQQDNLFCQPDAVDCSSAAKVLQEERPYYASEAHLQVVVVPTSGHCLNLHYVAPVFFVAALDWLDHVIPPDVGAH